MRLVEAQATAEALLAEMAPHCHQVEIAGSVRRCCPNPHDLELVAVPRWEPGPVSSLFGEADLVNCLHLWATAAAVRGRLRWIKPGTAELIDWQPKPDGRYWRALLQPEGVKLDLFLTRPENHGLILLIRTGSAEFSQATMAHALRIGWKCAGGQLWNPAGEVVPTPTEAEVFAALGLEEIPPEARTGAAALRMRRASEFSEAAHA